MIVINTVSNERFSLNGIEYFKNFLSFVYGDNVGIYNAYDKTDQRVSLDLYSNFIVDGVVYESAALLQSALLGVIYTRDTLGAVNTVLKGSVKPTDTPTGTGVAFWVATQAGTYTNFGGVIVSTNSFAVISRDASGAFSISQTTFDISSKVNVSDIVDNLTTDSAVKVASSRQVKLLNEKFTNYPTNESVNANFGLKTDLEIVENKTSEIAETSTDLKYSYAISDINKNVAFGIGYDGKVYLNQNLLQFVDKLSEAGFIQELESGTYRTSKLNTTGDGGEFYMLDELNNIALFCSTKGIFKLKIDPTYFLSNARNAGLFKSNYDQKNLLAIGDSLTAVLIWQTKCAELLGATASTHALGGIDFIGMVDGYGTLPALSLADVTGKDIIVLFGGYNERTQPLGVVGDVYPTQNTIAGRLQYAINKIYEKLTSANNLSCRVAIATPHCTGANGYVYVDGYTQWNGSSLKQIAEIMVAVSKQNNIPCYNSWTDSGIGKFNWNIFQSSATPNNSTYTYKGDFTSIGAVNFTPVTNDCVTVNLYTGYLFTGGTWVVQTTPKFPWKNDQLHLNTLGYEYLGKKFAQFINTI